MTHLNIRTRLSLSLILCFLLIQAARAQPAENSPKVVVSITPFYGLVAAIMQGVGTPTLLIQPKASVHHYTLKPSEIQAIQQASLIIWGGPSLETFLVKPLKTLQIYSPKTPILELSQIPKLLLLTSQQGACGHVHHALPEIKAHAIDMHFWLDPFNAIRISETIVTALTTLDPLHQTLYENNGKRLKKELLALDKTIAENLKGVKNIPFIVFHDAYQYFSHRYQLNMVGIITHDPESSVSAKRLNNILNIIQDTKAKCVFTEPNTQVKSIKTLVKDMPIKIGELDPEGDHTMQNEEGYFVLLNNLSNNLKQCLETPNP
jgi:zinc transport system substrate-binding protein